MHIRFTKYRALVLVVAGVLGAAMACATPIQPYGPGRYIVTYSSEISAARAQSAGVRDANKYCAEKFPGLS
jgi:hypothetical protein